MSQFWIFMLGVSGSVSLMLSGGASAPENHQGPTSTHDFYLTKPHAVPDSTLALTVTNQLSGNVTLMTGEPSKVTADAVATVAGVSLEQASEKEGRCITLNNTGLEVSVVLTAGCEGLSDQLHVRVPPGVNLNRISTPAGNIRVFGGAANVTAAIGTKGNIEVFGASGDVNLTTANGWISAELAPQAKSVQAQTQAGDINLFAEDTWVRATTGNGNIRFSGSLRAKRNNSLIIKGTGNLDAAVPADRPQSAQPYQISATTQGGPIITDFPPTVLTICGFVHSSGQIDQRTQNTPQRGFGRIEVSPGIATSAFFSGTLGDNFYLFDTDQTTITFSPPVPPNVHVYTFNQLTAYQRGEAHLDAGCEEALQASIPAPIIVDLKTGPGRIYFRHTYLTP